MEGLNAIIAALKRRQAGLLEQHRDRQRLVELESRFEELLVLDLSDNAESALSAYSESRGSGNASGSGSGSNLKERDVVQGSALLSPRPVTPVSPRGLRPPVRPLALSNQSLDTEDDLSVIPSLQSPHSGSAAPPPRLYLNWMFAHNRAVSWFAKLVYGCPIRARSLTSPDYSKFEVKEVTLQHKRHYLVARGLDGPESYSLPLLEYVTPPPEPHLKATSWTVSETHAILRYVCNTHPPAAVWYPQELSVRARVDEYLDWHIAVFRRAVHGLWQLVLGCLLHSASDTDQPMQKVRALVSDALQTLNARLALREFIATDEDPTIADVVAGADVYTLAQMGWDMSSYAQIERWRETMQLVRRALVAGFVCSYSLAIAARSLGRDEQGVQRLCHVAPGKQRALHALVVVCM